MALTITRLEPLHLPDGTTLLVIDTDEGVYGIGEVGMRSRWRAVRGAFDHFTQLLVGEDAGRIEHLWQVLFRSGFFPATGFVASAVAAVDMALWDIRGKALGVPVHQLFGGASRDHVECYVHLQPAGQQELTDQAQGLVEAGWRHLRLAADDPAGATGATAEGRYDQRAALRHTVATLQRLRAALGDEVELLLDVHTRFDPAQAVVLCRELEPLRPYFVEDPVRCEDLDSYRMVRARTGVPLAAGEQLTSKWEFRPLLEDDLIDFARVDVANAGLTEARKIAAMAEAHHINLVTHNPLGPVTTAASLQLNLTAPNVGVAEQVRPMSQVPEPFTLGPAVTAGRVLGPAAPGLGVDIDRAAARRLSTDSVSGDLPRLHRPDGSFTNW